MMNGCSLVPIVAFVWLASLGLSAAECPARPLCSAAHSAGVLGLCKLRDTVNALNNNVGRKINVTRRFRVGDSDVSCSLRSADVDPYSKIGTQLIPINVRRSGGIANLEDVTLSRLIEEFRVEGTLEVDAGATLTGSVSVDIPKTLEFVTSGGGGVLRRGKVNFRETLKRLDFIYQKGDLVLHGALNGGVGEGSVEVLKRLEDLYVLHGKYVHVTPKLELVFDRTLNSNTNFCLSFQRGKDSITPIIYPLARKFEVLAEKSITDDLKAGFFWSKDHKLFVNLSVSLPWGGNGWQTLAFRFVFPEVVKSHVHMLNEVAMD